MYSKARQTLTDISDMAEGAASICKKAERVSPRMKKEISVRSKYYSRDSEKHPAAESLMQLEIDCSLLKLGIIIAGCAVVLWVVCSMRSKKQRCR